MKLPSITFVAEQAARILFHFYFFLDNTYPMRAMNGAHILYKWRYDTNTENTNWTWMRINYRQRIQKKERSYSGAMKHRETGITRLIFNFIPINGDKRWNMSIELLHISPSFVSHSPSLIEIKTKCINVSSVGCAVRPKIPKVIRINVSMRSECTNTDGHESWTQPPRMRKRRKKWTERPTRTSTDMKGNDYLRRCYRRRCDNY